MRHDAWLDRWIPLIQERAADLRVLEIGCGYGDDTATLHSAGLKVVGFDLSAACIAVAKLRVPSARLTRRDLRGPLPAEATALGVVIASLCLHYFRWSETIEIVERIRLALLPRGILMCRLNSTDDVNFGASGYQEIEPGLYNVDGQPKRFFDEDSARLLFATGWRVLSIQSVITGKYIRSKAAWELVLERI